MLLMSLALRRSSVPALLILRNKSLQSFTKLEYYTSTSLNPYFPLQNSLTLLNKYNPKVKVQYRSAHYNPSNLILHIKNDEDAKQFCTTLWNEIHAKVSPKNNIGEKASENLEKLIKLFNDISCDTRNIFGFVSTNPRIVNCSWVKINDVVTFLDNLGLGGNRVLLVLNNRNIWTIDVARLSDRSSFLRRVGILEGNLQRLVTKCPQVLTLKKGKLSTVLNLLKDSHFTREQITTIINDSPRIFETNLKETEYLFQYVYFRMGLTDLKQMVQAKLFTYSVEHVRQRHLFLLRLGLYETPNIRSKTSSVNPKLHIVIDTSPSRFCKMFKVTSDEFTMFCQELINEESDYSNNDSTDSDSDYVIDEYESDNDNVYKR
ncbi:transcription termination factor 4, mitochondrial-like [Antedon mediterranea]|uniref:transcription termination factor 4, mitochondrial-like n=1 Tax=Antedon mediterranea TaxID=105859 RepID=UPI003AF8C9FE